MAAGDLAMAVQQALLQDVDSKVAEKVEELWQKGKQMLNQVQQRHQERNDKLNAEVSQCLERQRALEVENEQLKQVLADMTSRLTLLCDRAGTGGGCMNSTGTTSVGNSSVHSGSPPPTRGSDAMDIFTPVRGTASGSEAAPLAEVPPFPFPAQTTPPAATATPAAAPLLLSEALGARSPEKLAEQHQPPTLLSLASSLPQMPSMEAYAAGACASPVVFSFTIRKADETDLGLNVTQREQERVLCVEGVRAEGAVDAWNRQCLGGQFPEKAVLPGDMIISVNSVAYDPERMLEECKERQLLRLTISRGGLPLEQPPQTGAAGASPTPVTSLRAEASEFVPGAAVAPEATAAAAASPAAAA